MRSIARAKRAGQREQPCLVLLCSWKRAETRPFSRMLARGPEYSVCVHSIKRNGKPILLFTFHKYVYFTVSKAFAISNVAIGYWKTVDRY